jgi:GTP-binding protein
MFATQASTRPPTFVLFTTGFLEAGYRRFLERRLREVTPENNDLHSP